MSFKVEVLTFGEVKWASNAVRFATEEEAQQAAEDLATRWTMVKEYRTAESDDPVNYEWKDGGPVATRT